MSRIPELDGERAEQAHSPWLSEVLMIGAKLLAVVGHAGPVPANDGMTAPHALAALAALGQPTRLEIFRLLMRSGPEGVLAGSLAQTIGCPHNTLSSHLSILARAGLIRGTRDGRTILYSADIDGMRALLRFLINDCCNGHPELCDFIQSTSSATCCPPPRKVGKRRRP